MLANYMNERKKDELIDDMQNKITIHFEVTEQRHPFECNPKDSIDIV